MAAFPARVHIILAREARIAVVLRRGPSKSVCTLLWDRTNDTFSLGQWLRGRIYERRCDLSPDGSHFIYFAMNGKYSSEVKGSWTAISRTPYLKAIGLWANGSCWNGGGLFLTNSTFWLNRFRFGHEEKISPEGLVEKASFPFHESYGGECPGVYYIRLQRDGWNLAVRPPENTETFTAFTKALPGGWILEKFAHETIARRAGKGCYYDSHLLQNPDGGVRLDFPEWEWADFDQDRLVWVEKGILYTAQLTPSGLEEIRALFDFSPLSFEAIKAPYADPVTG